MKKIIIGSIIAVALLTLVSFSSVVGYSSVKSDLNIASPLFSIRNKKDDISSNYLGKGEESNILLPTRNRNKVLIVRFINRIKEMDDYSYQEFSDEIYMYLSIYSSFKENEILNFLENLNSIRVDTGLIIFEDTTLIIPTMQLLQPNCNIIDFISTFIITIIVLILTVIGYDFPSWAGCTTQITCP